MIETATLAMMGFFYGKCDGGSGKGGGATETDVLTVRTKGRQVHSITTNQTPKRSVAFSWRVGIEEWTSRSLRESDGLEISMITNRQTDRDRH